MKIRFLGNKKYSYPEKIQVWINRHIYVKIRELSAKLKEEHNIYVSQYDLLSGIVESIDFKQLETNIVKEANKEEN